jgi:hypothetical protein
MGVLPVALYSIPLKLTEYNIPLRSFVATAFQRCQRAGLHNQIDEVKAYSIRIQVP